MSSTTRIVQGIRSPEVRALFARAVEQGWTVRITGSGHVQASAPGHGSIIASRTTPSDHRAAANIRAEFRRAGLGLDPPVRAPKPAPEPALGPGQAYEPEPQAEATGPRLIDHIVGGMPPGWECPPWAVVPLTRPMPYPCRWCRTVVVSVISRRGNVATIEPDGALHATACWGENADLIERIDRRHARG